MGIETGCWYNEEGKEACPLCHERNLDTVKTIDVSICNDDSGHKLILTAMCSKCKVVYQFYQDDIGKSINLKNKEKKVLEPYKEEKKILPDENTKKKRSKKSKVEELAEEIANEIKIS